MIILKDTTSGQELQVREQDLRRILLAGVAHLTKLQKTEGLGFPPSDRAALRAALDIQYQMPSLV